MARHLLAVLALVLCGSTQAADKAPAGTWKVTLQSQDLNSNPLFLVKLEEKDGAWSGKLVATALESPRADLMNPSVKNGVLTFTLKVGDARISFEGKVAAEDATRITGSLQFPPGFLNPKLRRTLFPAALDRTTLTTLEDAAVLKDTIASSTNPAEVIDAASTLVRKAGFFKAKPEDVRNWMEKALKASEAFGERWQREILLEMVETLNDQDGMAQVTLPYARRAERMLLPKDRPVVHTRVLEALKSALKSAGKDDEAKAVEVRIDKLDTNVRTSTYAGRPAKNNRVVVFEMFTGVECPPCVAADLGFDALLKTFKPTEVIQLQYHVHVAGLDPIANAHTLKRFEYYIEGFGPTFASAPQTLVAGSQGTGGGGRKSAAQEKYDQYYDAIIGKLDEAAKVKLTAKATRKGDKIDVEADVADLQVPGMSMRLRLFVVEDVVDFKGGNGVEKHHHVVRAMPGGAEGVVLKEKTLKHKVAVDVADVRKEITKYLQDFYKKQEEELPKMLPLELKNLKVVALIQDDNTREVLHAIQIEVEDAK